MLIISVQTSRLLCFGTDTIIRVLTDRKLKQFASGGGVYFKRIKPKCNGKLQKL